LTSWLTFVLLALAAFRIYRLIAEDTILDKPRRWLLRMGDWREEGDPVPERYRREWAIFLTCPWCLGFWVSGALLTIYALAVDWPGVFWFAITWLAISSLVGLTAKNLDKEES
jgi:hypothetical protein